MRWLTDVRVLLGCVFGGFGAGLAIATTWKWEAVVNDWNMWSALGTIAAAVIALGIAVRQGVETRKERHAQGILMAARLAARLEAAVDAAASVQAYVCFSQDTSTAEFFSHVARQARDAVEISTPELMGLLPLPNHCAHRLATAFGHMETILIDIGRIGSGNAWESTLDFERKVHVDRWQKWASAANNLLRVAQRDFNQAVAFGVVGPTREEMFGAA